MRAWEPEFIRLWTEGASTEQIAAALGIPPGTASSRANTLQREGKITPRPKGGWRTRSTAAHPSTPPMCMGHTEVHLGTPVPQPTTVHRGTPHLLAQQPTKAHPGVPMPNDVAVRLLSLLPDLESMVARERDRQRLLSTPVGTPRHTTKKTYVVDTLYVDLIDRYAQAEGVELKDVVNLAFHEFFERRQYLPEEGPMP
jgi:hypothetical protein